MLSRRERREDEIFFRARENVERSAETAAAVRK